MWCLLLTSWICRVLPVSLCPCFLSSLKLLELFIIITSSFSFILCFGAWPLGLNAVTGIFMLSPLSCCVTCCFDANKTRLHHPSAGTRRWVILLTAHQECTLPAAHWFSWVRSVAAAADILRSVSSEDALSTCSKKLWLCVGLSSSGSGYADEADRWLSFTLSFSFFQKHLLLLTSVCQSDDGNYVSPLYTKYVHLCLCSKPETITSHPYLPCCYDSSSNPGEHFKGTLCTHRYRYIYVSMVGYLELSACAFVVVEWAATSDSCSSFHWWSCQAARVLLWCQNQPGEESKNEKIQIPAVSIPGSRLFCLPAGSYLKIKVSCSLLDCFSVPPRQRGSRVWGQSAHVFVGCILWEQQSFTSYICAWSQVMLIAFDF